MPILKRQGAAVEVFGFAVVVLGVEEPTQVVAGAAEIGVVDAEVLFLQGQRALQEGLGTPVGALDKVAVGLGAECKGARALGR